MAHSRNDSVPRERSCQRSGPSRRQFFTAAGAGLAGAVLPFAPNSSRAQMTAPMPSGPDYIVRNAYLVTLDSLGDIPSGEEFTSAAVRSPGLGRRVLARTLQAPRSSTGPG